MSLFRSISNLLFVPDHICLFCRENLADHSNYICNSCWNLLEVTNREIDLNLRSVDRVYYSLFYNRFIREKIHSFKFQDKPYLYKPFGEILVETVRVMAIDGKVDAIAFVPTHRRKKALRGYNQSQLLASYIADKSNLSLLDKHLVKVKKTMDQNKLSKIEREKNLQNAFQIMNHKDIKDKEILLVDDIITTGTTMEECGKVLLEGGAKSVIGLALTSSMKI